MSSDLMSIRVNPLFQEEVETLEVEERPLSPEGEAVHLTAGALEVQLQRAAVSQPRVSRFVDTVLGEEEDTSKEEVAAHAADHSNCVFEGYPGFDIHKRSATAAACAFPDLEEQIAEEMVSERQSCVELS